MIAPNVIIPFDGNHADIPAGFTRETSLDGKYPKGTANATDPNTTGGAATHTHTGTAAHSHTLPSHTHAGSLTTPSGDTREVAYYGSYVAYFAPKWSHTHTFTTGGSSGGTTGATTASYGAVSNDPPYYTVIFIKSGGYNFIPNNGMILSQATSRAGLTFHSASAGKYLKGAGTGANAGGTGGSTTNAHPFAHTHTTTTHTHSSSTSSGATASSYGQLNSGESGGEPPATHTHPISFVAGTQAIAAFSGNLITTETVEPAYRTLNAFKNASGSNQMASIGDIALWLGPLASIPSGWILCDGTNNTPDMRGRYLKINSTPTTSSTGGSNTHTHASQPHTHPTGATHTHTGTSEWTTGVYKYVNGSQVIPYYKHTHTVSVTAKAVQYNSANTAANPSSNEPEYRTVAYIQMQTPPATGQPLMALLENTWTY